MAIEVKVPSVGESVTSGVLASWRVKDGDYVRRDDPLFDLETDKVTQEAVAEADGLIALKADEGDEVDIGQVVAEIDDSADEPDGGSDAGEKDEESEPKEKEAATKAKSTGRDKDGTEVDDNEDEDAKRETEPRHPLSPAARRAAEETGVDPSRVKGSGKDGRVTKSDILEAAEGEKDESKSDKSEQPSQTDREEPAATTSATKSDDRGDRTTRKKLSPMRRRIGERLVASQRDTATLTTFNEVDLSTVKELRAKYQDGFVKKHGVKLGFMSFFVKAAVYALKQVPEVNCRLEEDALIQNHFYDIAVAVSTDKGLLVPVLRDCDRLGYGEIESTIGDLAQRAREGKVQLDELEGGVFTITNGGIFGSMLSTPVINPPQSAILGMHSIQDRPVVIDGEIKVRPMMFLALSYDHRVIDGREAVTFLRKIKEALEDPSRTLLEV